MEGGDDVGGRRGGVSDDDDFVGTVSSDLSLQLSSSFSSDVDREGLSWLKTTSSRMNPSRSILCFTRFR